MNTSTEYQINLKSLKEGLQERKFQIGNRFFEPFESSPVSVGNLNIILEVDRRNSHYALDFTVNGTVQVECDRCLEEFDLMLEGNFQYTIKYAEERKEEEEVIFLLRSDDTYNISQLIYESILLSIPMKKIGPECLEEDESDDEPYEIAFGPDNTEEEEQDDNSDNNIWAELKNLKDLK
ncbi:MAG: DUF177 domain-containing protein [Bacteroidota bacterium]